MNLKDMIYRRRSTRSYKSISVDDATTDKIRNFIEKATPLFPQIQTRTEIIGKEKVKCILPWITQKVIVFFSEEKEGMYENAGFILQQADLYMQSLGLGVCWLGMGRMSDAKAENTAGDGMKFVIMLTFGYPENSPERSEISQFRRRTLSEISDVSDERLEPARLAPSSVNSQPWYFTHEEKVIHVYRTKPGVLGMLGNMNRIDIGICLAHMYVSNPESFRFFNSINAKPVKGCVYFGSFEI